MIKNVIVALAALVLVGCGATTGGPVAFDEGQPAAGATSCLSGDQLIPDGSQCLQDDAACYPLANGDWCTGPRMSSCPMGSSSLPADLPCPVGARCFTQSESLQCVIGE